MIVRRGLLGAILLATFAFPTMLSADATVRCESKGGRHDCRVDDISRVIMRRQLSVTACIEGENWGYTHDYVWVDRGCRADFDVVQRRWERDREGSGRGERIICESDGRRRFCPADTRFGVEVARTLSHRDCVRGRNWDYNDRGIWVDDGCRAEFVLGTSRREERRDERVERRPEIVICEADFDRRHDCAADTRYGVELRRQLSKTTCVFGRTWGYDRDRIWVANGCRAEFLVRGR